MTNSVLKRIPIVLLGCGGVGQQLISHILATRTLHSGWGLHISVLAVSDSKCLVRGSSNYDSELEDAILRQIILLKASGSPLSSLQSYDSVEVCNNSLKNDLFLEQGHGLKGMIMVDCTASQESAYLLSKAVDLGNCVVLANKKPLTSTLEIYDKLFRKWRRLRFESTVGAGLPVISAVTRFLTSGDPITQIVGVLSGTLGFVMSNLQEGRAFSSVVQQAKSLGYTEPDPRDDLSGIDVARKALILSRLMGWRINMTDVEVESLFPMQLSSEKVSVDQFLAEGICSLDKEMSERVIIAKSRGCVLRYVAKIVNGRCKVGIEEVPKDSALGQLKGSDNLVEIFSRCYNKSPFVIQGAGAGNDTTACGVLADILDLQDLF